MPENFELTHSDHLLKPCQDRGQALVNEAYGWTKPVAVAVGTAAAVGASIYLLHRGGLGLGSLVKGKGLACLSGEVSGALTAGISSSEAKLSEAALASEAASISGASMTRSAVAQELPTTLEILQSKGLLKTTNPVLSSASEAASVSEAAITRPVPAFELPSTLEILESKGLLKDKGLGYSFEQITAGDVERAGAIPLRTGRIESHSFPNVKHSLAEDGTFKSVYDDGRVIVKHPDGAETIARLTDSGFTTGRNANGDLLINGRVSAPFTPRELEAQVLTRPPLREHEQLIQPWQSPDRSVTVFKDGSTLTQFPNADSTLRAAMGIEMGASRGNLIHQTVLDRLSNTETTYFSNGAALEVSENGVSRVWTPKPFEKPAPADYFSDKGNLSTFNWNTGKYESIQHNGHRFTSWKGNGLRIEELTDGAVHFTSDKNRSFLLGVDSFGEARRLTVSDHLRSSLGSLSQHEVVNLDRVVAQAADGSMVTGLSNGLAIRELNDGGVQVMRNSAAGIEHLFVASKDGRIIANPNLALMLKH